MIEKCGGTETHFPCGHEREGNYVKGKKLCRLCRNEWMRVYKRDWRARRKVSA